MNDQSVKKSVADFIKRCLARESDMSDIDYNNNLITAGIVDSLGIVKLINYLENTFSIKIRDEDMVPENFETIECIANYIQKVREQNTTKIIA